MDRNELERPFHSSIIERAKGRGGEKRFVGVAHYIRRLNQAFGGRWSFDVVEYKILDNEVLVLGRIRVDDTEKMAFGGSSLTKKSGGTLCVADDLKAASSDALKKAASLFGLGLDIYSRREPDRPSSGNGKETRRRPPARAETRDRPPSANGRFPEHVEQLLSAADKLRWTRSQLAKWVRERFGVSFPELSRDQAESALEQMREIARAAKLRDNAPRPSELDMERHVGADVAKGGAGVVGVGRLQ